MPDTPQVAVSANNPCPFLRALVANGTVGGHIVPLSKLRDVIEAASGKQGAEKTKAGIATYLIALIANGFAHVPRQRRVRGRSLTSCATARSTSTAPDRASSAWMRRCIWTRSTVSRPSATTAKIHPAAPSVACRRRRSTPSWRQTSSVPGIRRNGPTRYMMKGEWPVLLDILGKGEGDARYLSVAEVRTLFVDRRLPDRIAARLPKP